MTASRGPAIRGGSFVANSTKEKNTGCVFLSVASSSDPLSDKVGFFERVAISDVTNKPHPLCRVRTGSFTHLRFHPLSFLRPVDRGGERNRISAGKRKFASGFVFRLLH